MVAGIHHLQSFFAAFIISMTNYRMLIGLEEYNYFINCTAI
jgi:hypothetical protein